VPLPHDPGPHWGEVGIHGLHRQREWDVVVPVERPGVSGDEVWFVALEDGSAVVESGDADPDPFRRAIDLAPPFRARAVRRDDRTWAVAARRIETVDLADETVGDSIEIAWDGSERTVRIDGAPTLAGVPVLERLAAARHATYVVTAARVSGATWEVAVSPL
jgi:hypothetical protein